MPNAELVIETVEPLPSDPFRGDVGLTNHPSDSGVKQSKTVDTVVTSSFEHGISGLGDGTDGNITLPSDPFRGDVGLSNYPSGSGVNQPGRRGKRCQCAQL